MFRLRHLYKIDYSNLART